MINRDYSTFLKLTFFCISLEHKYIDSINCISIIYSIFSFFYRMVSPGSAPLLSCAPGLTQNATRAARAVVQTGSVTWTAAVKTSTALVP